MKFTPPKRLRQEDFPEDKIVGRLAPLYNSLVDTVTSALRNGISFADNTDGMVREIFTDGTYPLKVQWPRTSRPAAVWIGKIRRADGADAALSAAITIDWKVADDGSVQIDNLVGLSASSANKYYVTIIGVTG